MNETQMKARIAELEDQIASIGAGGVESLRKTSTPSVVARLAAVQQGVQKNEIAVSAVMLKVTKLIEKRIGCEPCAEAEADLLEFLRKKLAATHPTQQGLELDANRFRKYMEASLTDDRAFHDSIHSTNRSVRTLDDMRAVFDDAIAAMEPAQAKQGGV